MPALQELIRLAREAEERAQLTVEPDDLDRAVTAWESAVIATGDAMVDPSERADVLSHASGAVLHRYQATRARREDLGVTQGWLEEAIAITPEDAPERLMYLSNAGVICQERYTAGEGRAMLDRAVDSFESAVRLAAPHDPDLAQYLNKLGNALVDRWAAGADGEDLHRAVAAATRAVGLLPRRSPDQVLYLNNLGNALLHRYEYGGAVEDLDAAVRSLGAAARGGRLLRRSGDLDDRAMALANLGSARRLRANHSGDPRDLRRAWSALRRAVGHTRPGSPDLPSRQAGLADVMRERYLSDGRVGGLDRAISVYEAVLGQVTTAGYCNNFATCLLTRYLAQGNRPDLDGAGERPRQAVALAEAGPAESTAMCLASLGGGLRWRYLAGGDEADIREALAVHRRAVALSPGVTLARGQRLSNLANALHDHYGRTGELADLDEAIEVYREAVGTVPADSAAVVQIRGNLGTALADRYQLRHVGEDLDEAIANFQEAGARGWRAQRSVHLDNLATALRERYDVGDDRRDLEQALTAHRLALR